MEIAPAMDFNFNSASHSGGSFYSSPHSSPTRMNEFYCRFDELLIASHASQNSCHATVPFAWEEKPGVPKTPTNLSENEFSFDVSCHFGKDSVAAEDLFHGGVIKTIDPPQHKVESVRGRERRFSSNSRLPSSRSRRTRSLSPLGASDYRREQQQQMTMDLKVPSTPARPQQQNGSKRWSFKDFFLFRSASDGRAMDKDPLKKYSTRNNNSSESGSVSKRRGRVSAHELHYNYLNRANSNEMKKKTSLPYKQSILGGLSFN